MVITLAEHPDITKYDLSSLKTIYSGTAPMPVATLKRAMQTLKCNFSQTYGLTETYVPVSILRPEDHILDGTPEEMQRLYSAGREVPGVRVRIVDDKGREVRTGDIGEITVKGANVMKGYWNQPELTKEALKGGWLYTGDMGRMDRLRYLYVVDRKKDMIISGGENIYAKEVEDVLVTHPAVAQAVVIGVPDDKWGESVKALIVKRKGGDATEEEIINFCKDRLSSFKKPKSVEFVEDFPKSTAGKILKRELREKYWAGKERKI
jgi:long-chain acyl-CoA synthetase